MPQIATEVVLVRPNSLDAFDFLIVVYLNIGYFSRVAKKYPLRAGDTEPEIFVLPQDFVAAHISKTSSWGKLRLRGLDLSPFQGRKGIDRIARRLRVEYPVKAADAA